MSITFLILCQYKFNTYPMYLPEAATETIFLDFCLFAKLIQVFQEDMWSVCRKDTIFPGAHFLCAPNWNRFSMSTFFWLLNMYISIFSWKFPGRYPIQTDISAIGLGECFLFAKLGKYSGHKAFYHLYFYNNSMFIFHFSLHF